MSKTPKLRFKEFSGDWESKTVKQLMNEKIIEQPLDGNHGEIHPTTNDYVETGIPFIMASDLYNGKVDYLNCKYISEETAKGLRKGFAKEGDVLITHKATIGEIALVKNIDTNYIVLTPQVTYYRVNDYSILNNIYLKSYFESANFMNTFKKIASDGSTRSYIGITKQQELDIRYPKIEEQEKIASFFSLIDDKICLQSEKVEVLKDYKTGMMQKIFSRELRFKDDDGRDYPEWENIRLSEVLKERKTYSQKNEGLEHVTLSKDGIYGKGERYNRDFLVVTDDKKYKITRLGDICYNPANLKFGVICRNDYGDAIFSPIYVTFEVKSEADSEYMGVYLSRWDFINRVRKYEEGTVYERMAVKPEDFLRFEINLPTIEEQKKIKGLFNKIDEKVKFEEEKLNRLNEYKKGLLQQMFV